MIKAFIRLQYKDKEYQSDIINYTEEEFNNLRQLVKDVTKGKLLYFAFVEGDREYFFSSSILEKSIITIYKEEVDVKRTST